MNNIKITKGGQTVAAGAIEPPMSGSERRPCSAWIACSERLPPDFQRVLMDGRDLGCYVGSLRDGRWRVYTPLDAGGGRRIMVEDLPAPEYWMPLPPLPNSKCPNSELGQKP